MVFCQSPDLEIDSGLIALFDSSAPTGWTRFTALDNRFPRAASNYGGEAGSATHTHNTTSSGYNTGTENDTAYASGGTTAAGDHYHTTQAGTTDSANNLPPLSWDRYTDLDDAFPRGASMAGGSGSITATSDHTHSCTTTTNAQSNLPPYTNVIYGQRKDPSVSTSLGGEEEVGGEAENPVTYSNLCRCIVFLMYMRKCENGGTNRAIRATPGRNCWPQA
jgi:hypothetical protein